MSIQGAAPPTSNLASCQDARLQSSGSMNPILLSSTSLGDISSNLEIKLSSKRWLVLAAFSVFGITIALTDVTSPILKLFLNLMDLSIKDYLYLQPLFYYFMMGLAFPTAMLVDKYGIKAAMHVSAILFILHGFLRAVIFFPQIPYHASLKLPCYIVSSIIGVEMMTILFLLPLKISETWFSATERSVAWAIMISQLNVGVSVASFVYPRIVRTIQDFKILAYVNIVCCLLTALTTLTFITKSEPDHPPNERVAKANQETPVSFRKSLIKMLKHWDIIAHLIHLSIFESLVLCITSVLQPVLKSIGYDEIFTGNLMSASSVITIIMQIFMASFVHGVKNPILVCKLGSFMQGLLFVVYMYAIVSAQPSWVFVSATIIFHICKSWVSPNFTNMTAHLAVGTVSQATVVGFSMSITVLIMTVTNFTFTKLIVISEADDENYQYSLIFLSILSLVNELFYLGFFHGRQAKHDDNSSGLATTGTRSS